MHWTLALGALAVGIVVGLTGMGGGSIVHLRNGTVRLDLVRWLCLGSVPSAFAGCCWPGRWDTARSWRN